MASGAPRAGRVVVVRLVGRIPLGGGARLEPGRGQTITRPTGSAANAYRGADVWLVSGGGLQGVVVDDGAGGHLYRSDTLAPSRFERDGDGWVVSSQGLTTELQPYGPNGWRTTRVTDTSGNIDDGTSPTGALAKKWGSQFSAEEQRFLGHALYAWLVSVKRGRAQVSAAETALARSLDRRRRDVV